MVVGRERRWWLRVVDLVERAREEGGAEAVRAEARRRESRPDPPSHLEVGGR